MNSRGVLILGLLLTLSFVQGVQAAPVQGATSTTTTTTTTTTSTTTKTTASAPYTENVNIYTAGDNALWTIAMSPSNTTRATIQAAEQVSGLNSYQITAISTTAATTSTQLFWSDGYGLVDLPFIPDQGVFLTLDAASGTNLAPAVSDFDSYLGVDFTQVSSNSTSTTYFSPAAFSAAGGVLYENVPLGRAGLATMLTEANFESTVSPMITLTGVRSGSGFTHTVTIGSTQTDATSSGGGLALANVFNATATGIVAAASSTSTTLTVHSLDGLIVSSDKTATVSNNRTAFSGTYTVAFAAGKQLRPNVTLVQDPPILTSFRELDKQSVNSGDLVSVTVVMSNAALSGSIENITADDNWYAQYPNLFSLSAGNSSFTIPSLPAGQNVSRVYVLKVDSSATQDITIPTLTLSYLYSEGGQTFRGSATTNQVELRTNSVGPAMAIQVLPTLASGSPLGELGRYVVTVTNNGNGPALNLNVGNFTDPNLAQNGGVWKFNTTIPLSGLTTRNYTNIFTLGWTAPDGTKGALVSNQDTMLLSHTGVALPFVRFIINATLPSTALTSGMINATYTLTNTGSVSATQVTVSQPLPTGVSCSKVVKGPATCTTSALSLTASSLGATTGTVTGTVALTFAKDNYVVLPASIVATYRGVTLHDAGAPFLVPAGIQVSKTYAVNPVFVGMTDTAVVKVANAGSLPLYNVTVTPSPDTFANTTAGSTRGAYPELDAGVARSFNYTVHVAQAGTQNMSAVAVSLVFAGFTTSFNVAPGSVSVYRSLTVSTEPVPSTPVEGKGFSLQITVMNPSAVAVSNVAVSIPVPAGVKISNASGVVVQGQRVDLNAPSMAARANATGSVTLVAGTDGDLDFANGTVSFQYAGATVKNVAVIPSVAVGVDLPSRYEYPIAAAVLMALGAAYYVQRKLAPPASPATTAAPPQASSSAASSSAPLSRQPPPSSSSGSNQATETKK